MCNYRISLSGCMSTTPPPAVQIYAKVSKYVYSPRLSLRKRGIASLHRGYTAEEAARKNQPRRDLRARHSRCPRTFDHRSESDPPATNHRRSTPCSFRRRDFRTAVGTYRGQQTEEQRERSCLTLQKMLPLPARMNCTTGRISLKYSALPTPMGSSVPLNWQT